jgi:hypothetical protein
MLTIDKVSYNNRSKLFELRLPNKEVAQKFYTNFANSLNKYFQRSPKSKKIDFYNIIIQYNDKDLSMLFNSVFGSIPARHHRSEESYYHSVLHGYLFDMPDAVISLAEQPGSIGTPDMVVVFNDGLCAVIELKYDKGDEEDLEDDGKFAARGKKAAKKKKKPGPAEAEILKTLTQMANDALAAIEKKKYADPYEGRAKKVIKIGLGVYGRGQCLAKITS